MKILYTTASHLGGTGISNVSFHASKAIYEAGYLDKVITYRNKQILIPKSHIKRTIFQPAKIFSGLSSRYYYSMKRMWLDYRASQYLESHQVDIVHAWTHECLRTIRAAKKNGVLSILDRGYSHPRFSKKILDEEFDIYGVKRNLEKCPQWLSPFDHWRRELEEACEEFDQVDYIYVNSDFCRQTFIDEGVSSEKLRMLPRGFDSKKYYPVDKKDDVFRVIFVGQLLVRKGLKYLLEAWAQLGLHNAELLIVGSMMDEVRALVSPYLERSDIKHVGFVPDPVAAYQSSDLFVLPTVDEGSAKVTYEAMACGIPVIVTHNAGSLAKDGEDGYIVPIRSSHALAEKILYLYQNRELCKLMGVSARNRIKTYDWDFYENNLINSYRSVFPQKL
jgi:glycosyltransferase involved in cell wall biosynthesis